MLGNEVAVNTLAHVIVSPVHAVEVEHHRVPRLMNHLRAIQIQQSGLEAVHQARPGAVIAGISQHKRLVFGIGSILKQFGIEGFRAINGLGAELEGFLRQIQTEVACQFKSGALVKHLRAVQ